MRSVVLYTRSGCHLCDEARSAILSVLAREPFSFDEVDIDTDDDLVRDYGIRIPVVTVLIHEIRRALGLTQHWSILIAGVGNLGQALARYKGFAERGFRVAALIDVDPAKVGSRIDGMEVRHLDELPKLVRAERVAIGVIATPATDAQDVADRMVQAGLRSILNFAPAMLTVPEGVTIRKVDLAIELQILSYYEQRDALGELKGSIGKPGGAIAGS